MSRVLIRQEQVNLPTYTVIVNYYSDDSILVCLFDALDELIESIEVFDEPEQNNYGFSAN